MPQNHRSHNILCLFSISILYFYFYIAHIYPVISENNIRLITNTILFGLSFLFVIVVILSKEINENKEIPI
jgi:hypothetical protein